MKNAETLPAEETIQVNDDQTVARSVTLPFDLVAQMVDLSVPLRRPKKRSPDRSTDQALSDELAAWDAASDEAHELFEDDLSE